MQPRCATRVLPAARPLSVGRAASGTIGMDLHRTILATSILALAVARPGLGAETAPPHGMTNEFSSELGGEKLTDEVFTDLAKYLDVRFGKNTDDLPELRAVAGDLSPDPESPDHSMVPLPPAVSSAISLGAAFLSVRALKLLRKSASRRSRTLT
ncbi:MAG: hypothetical protein H7144_00225 [Burkholderiales bacterium]|nr:hypothetical protein [Phycisphaerae bacterium]